MRKPTKIKDFPGRVVDAHLKATGLLPNEVPAANTPSGLRWWAAQCANYGGLERAFNEAAEALENLNLDVRCVRGCTLKKVNATLRRSQ